MDLSPPKPFSSPCGYRISEKIFSITNYRVHVFINPHKRSVVGQTPNVINPKINSWKITQVSVIPQHHFQHIEAETNSSHLTEDISKWIFLTGNCHILVEFLWNWQTQKCPVNNKPSLNDVRNISFLLNNMAHLPICIFCCCLQSVNNPDTKFMGQHGAHLGPVGPRWAPCWPHGPCYQGILTTDMEVFTELNHPVVIKRQCEPRHALIIALEFLLIVVPTDQDNFEVLSSLF